MSHDHGAEVLGDNLDKEVEDQRLRPLGPLAPIGPGIPILSLEVDMYEDFARVEMGETRMITGPKLQDEAMVKRCKNTKQCFTCSLAIIFNNVSFFEKYPNIREI